MTWPTRTQQIGLLVLLAALVAIAMVNVNCKLQISDFRLF
jgi:hypothetical protein